MNKIYENKLDKFCRLTNWMAKCNKNLGGSILIDNLNIFFNKNLNMRFKIIKYLF